MNDYIQKDRRKSKFVETNESKPTDYFDIVRMGQNLKVAQSVLIAAFGTTGSLVSVGESGAIPVLNAIGTINQIRALLGGSGITTSLSPQGGIEIKQNFEVDKSGVPIMINETALQPTMVSLQAGAGISIGAAGKAIQIALSDTPPSTKTVIVYTEDDLPPIVGDIITLDPDTFYVVVADITTSNRIIFQENSILSGSDYITTFTYSGTGIFLNATDVNFKIVDITISAPLGTLFGFSDDGTRFFRCYTSTFYGADVGVVNNYAVMIMLTCNFFISGQGIEFSGGFVISIMDTVGITIPSGTGNAITLGTATFDYFLLDKALAQLDTTGVSISGLIDSGNINAGGLGTVINSRNFGIASVTDNITPFDDRWEFQLNANIINSASVLLATHAGGTIPIATSLTPVIVGATWIPETGYRFESTSGGRFTYHGKGSDVSVDVSISGQAATATHTYAFYLYKNGVQIANSIVTRAFTTASGNLAMVWDLLLATDDYIEVWVENLTGNADFVVDALTVRMKGS